MIDAHAHLDDRRFADDLDSVLARASAAGIDRVLSCGDDLASSERTVLIARRHAAVRVAVGVHPHHADSWTDAISGMVNRLARDEHVVAIGEIGLDFSGRSAPREAQERAFLDQLALARALDLPVVVHVRDAGPVARALIDRSGGARGMVHCFSERPADVEEWLQRGFYVSFAGTITYRNSPGIRKAAGFVSPDRVLVETDAPHLAPDGYRGKRNEPAYVMTTLAELARERGEHSDWLGRQIAENARKLFGYRF